jgi:hypothetical protein
MALDFDDLPPERPVPDKPPSKLLWTIVFFVLVLTGVFSVLLLWPAGEPTHTPWFWTCLTAFPLGVASLLVSRRFSAYEGTRLEAQSWNSARQTLAEERYAHESVPMLVLASSLRVTERDAHNGAAQIAKGQLALHSKASQHEDDDSISARWLEPDDCLLCADDKERHGELIEWLFDRLLDDLADSVAALPDGFPLRVVLNISGYLGEKNIASVWNASWAGHGLRDADVTSVAAPVDLMTIDQWLDDGQGPLHRYAVLLISASLSRVLDASPADGSAEAGVGLLLAAPTLATEFKTPWSAAVHRPLIAHEADLDHALTCAVGWAQIEPSALEANWTSGVNGETVGPLNAALTRTRVRREDEDPLQRFDLDSTVGDAGLCAGWLGVVCAVERAREQSAPQLVVRMRADDTVVVVVRSGNETSETNEIESQA